MGISTRPCVPSVESGKMFICSFCPLQTSHCSRVLHGTCNCWSWPRNPSRDHQLACLASAFSHHVQVPEWHDDVAMDQQWAQWAAPFESCFDGFLPQQPGSKLSKNQRGRLQQQRPMKRKCQTLTVRPSRPGEGTMRSQLLGQVVQHWFRQLRQLQSYLHAITA